MRAFLEKTIEKFWKKCLNEITKDSFKKFWTLLNFSLHIFLRIGKKNFSKNSKKKYAKTLKTFFDAFFAFSEVFWRYSSWKFSKIYSRILLWYFKNFSRNSSRENFRRIPWNIFLGKTMEAFWMKYSDEFKKDYYK